MARIMVVDDEPSLLMVLCELLKLNHHKVTTFQSCEKAKKVITSDRKFDLLILDVRMSPIDGMQLLKCARAKHPEMKVVMLTAYDSDESSAEARRLGAYAYLAKPFLADRVVETVESALAASG